MIDNSSATMCVIMSRNQVGVRELRQNLSVYLREVKKGTYFEVTERGKPVALLRPFPVGGSALDRLKAAGQVIPATRKLADLGPPLEGPTEGPTLSEILAEDREGSR